MSAHNADYVRHAEYVAPMLKPVDYDDPIVNRIAKEFHLRYEEFAGLYNYETRRDSAVPWEDVPEANKRLMVHVVASLLGSCIIDPGTRIDGSGCAS